MGKTSFKRILRTFEKNGGGESRKPWENDDCIRAADEPKKDAPTGTVEKNVTNLGSEADKDSAAAVDEAGAAVDEAGAAVDEAGAAVEIYTDKTVCALLRVRRRILAEARTAASRGRDWDAIGEEVGMTRSWINDYALGHGIVPDFFGSALERVSGQFVSARLVGTTPNRCIVQVELEATGKREFCRTRNIVDHPIHYKEIFTCIRVDLEADRHLEWIAGPNEVKY